MTSVIKAGRGPITKSAGLLRAREEAAGQALPMLISLSCQPALLLKARDNAHDAPPSTPHPLIALPNACLFIRD